MKIILASSSINRKKLLDRMGFDYTIIHPDFEEIIDPQKSNQTNIKAFALGKAKSVFETQRIVENHLIMGFDSMIEIDGTIIGKPPHRDAAFDMIKSFIGKEQWVTSGIALLGQWENKPFQEVTFQSTRVVFRSDITDKQINDYLAFGDWTGKCGAYSILGMGQFFLETIDGDFQNIIGIPVLKMGQMIQSITGQNPLTIFHPQNT